MNDIFPILKTLWRNKTGPLLMIVQLAITLAVVSNAVFIVQERNARIDRPTGIAENEIIHFPVRLVEEDGEFASIIREDITAILTHSDVIAAAHTTSIPLSGSGSSTSFRTDPNPEATRHSSATFQVSEGIVDTLGLKIVAGRNFRPEEIRFLGQNENATELKALITENFAESLFAGESAVGKSIFRNKDTSIQVIGVVSDMMGPWPNWDVGDASVFFPATNNRGGFHYVVRTRPEKREALLVTLHEMLKTRDSRRIVRPGRSLEDTKRGSYQSDYAMKRILSAVVGLIIAVNILGLIGMTTFWVNQRQKHIGIRRALGASRHAIARYFILENVLICAIAIALGSGLAFIANGSMRASFSSDVLPFQFIVYSSAVLVFVSLSAVAIPALRASRVPPSVATAS